MNLQRGFTSITYSLRPQLLRTSRGRNEWVITLEATAVMLYKPQISVPAGYAMIMQWFSSSYPFMASQLVRTTWECNEWVITLGDSAMRVRAYCVIIFRACARVLSHGPEPCRTSQRHGFTRISMATCIYVGVASFVLNAQRDGVFGLKCRCVRAPLIPQIPCAIYLCASFASGGLALAGRCCHTHSLLVVGDQ
jgi:hypothetical protein